MQHFEILTTHQGQVEVYVDELAFAIPEYRSSGPSRQSLIAVAKMIKGEPALLLQTHDVESNPQEAALLQAVETGIHFASEMPLTGEGTALSIWGIILVSYIEY